MPYLNHIVVKKLINNEMKLFIILLPFCNLGHICCHWYPFWLASLWCEYEFVQRYHWYHFQLWRIELLQHLHLLWLLKENKIWNIFYYLINSYLIKLKNWCMYTLCIKKNVVRTMYHFKNLRKKNLNLWKTEKIKVQHRKVKSPTKKKS